MSKIKNFFNTPKKAIISSLCIIALICGLGAVTVFAAGTIAENSAIGYENACSFAYADAGVSSDDVKNLKYEFDFEYGHFVYEIEFTANGIEYDYLIKSSDGTVIGKEIESVSSVVSSTDSQTTTAVSGETTTLSETTTVDTAVPETTTASSSASTATTAASTTSAPTTTSSQTTAAATTQIGSENAKSKALADAGLSSSDVTFTECKLDYDDGVLVYEIEFYTSSNKYEYEINAITGTIREKSIDALSASSLQTTSSTASSSYIGIDSAKAIATSKAGLSVSDVMFKKAKLDYDDGLTVYEIEFYYAGREYEVEIDATTGAILEYEYE